MPAPSNVAAALAALAQRLGPHHLAGVGVQRVDVAEVGPRVHTAVGHHRSRVDHASVRRLRPPGDAEPGDVARVDRLLLELLAVAVEGAAVERPLAAGGVGRCAAGKREVAAAGVEPERAAPACLRAGDGAGRGPRPSPACAAHSASNRRPRRLSRSETIRPLRRLRLTVLRRAMRSERLARRPLTRGDLPANDGAEPHPGRAARDHANPQLLGPQRLRLGSGLDAYR